MKLGLLSLALFFASRWTQGKGRLFGLYLDQLF